MNLLTAVWLGLTALLVGVILWELLNDIYYALWKKYALWKHHRYCNRHKQGAEEQ